MMGVIRYRSILSPLLGGLLILVVGAACRSGGDGLAGRGTAAGGATGDEAADTMAAEDAAAGAETSSASGLSLVVDLAARRLYVYESGALTHTYVVSVGMPGHRTPVGSYRIGHLVWNPWWIPPRAEWTRGKKATPPGPENPMGRVKMYFAPEYYIHGTPERGTLGEPVSHGCIRMYEEDAIALARLVLHYGGSKVSASEIERILAEPSHTVTMPVPAPIPLQVRTG